MWRAFALLVDVFVFFFAFMFVVSFAGFRPAL